MPKFIRIIALAAVAGIMTAVPIAPAQAATVKCSAWQSKSFDLPNKPDITVSIAVCIHKDGNYRHGYFLYKWPATTLFGKRFDKFVLKPRLERYDTDIKLGSCDITGVINDSSRAYAGRCVTPTSNSSAQGGWTGDGSVTYNIDADGLGDRGWSLTGSPAVT